MLEESGTLENLVFLKSPSSFQACKRADETTEPLRGCMRRISTPPHPPSRPRHHAMQLAHAHARRPMDTAVFSAGLGRATGLPWPLPEDTGAVRYRGYFVDHGKEALPHKWTGGAMARPVLSDEVSGIDTYHKQLCGQVDHVGKPTIAVFMKTGPQHRAPALVSRDVSVNESASVLAARVATDLDVVVTTLSHHGVELDLSKPLKEQGVFRDPVLLEWA